MGFELIVFDLDGVLVEEPSSWWTLHKAFGTFEVSRENLYAYEAGKIDYPEFMRRDIRLWGQRNIWEVEALLQNFTLNQGASEICNVLQQQGYKLAIVSAGIDILARTVSEKLGIEYWVSNGLEVDIQGNLTGEGIFRVDLIEKHLALKKLLRPLRVELSNVIAIGDSKYDIPLMTSCGAGIFFIRQGNSTKCTPCTEPLEKIHALGDLLQTISKIENRRKLKDEIRD